MNKNPNICIVDYGSGNVSSVYNVFNKISPNVIISHAADDLEAASHIVLPGVGSFARAMQKLKALDTYLLLEKLVLKQKKPFLGICVGMQILVDTGQEGGHFEGLGWIPGHCKKIKTSMCLPHVGWNNFIRQSSSPLLKNVTENLDFYFVHSYAVTDCPSEYIIGESDYGSPFVAAIQKDNIFGVQFHPEKSQKTGKVILNNFLALT